MQTVTWPTLEPFPWYRRMRDEAPVSYDAQRGSWNVFRFEDVKRVLSDYAAFSSDFSGGSRRCDQPPGSSIISTDPPIEGVLRHRSPVPSMSRRNHHGMQRTTVFLPDDLIRRLRQIATERGTSVAALLREAAEEQAQRHRPRPQSIGIGDYGCTDTARRTGDERPMPRSRR